MSLRRVMSRWVLSLAVAGLGVAIPLSAVAVDSVPPEALNVKVFPDRYVAAGKPFSDLAALEAWAKPIRIRTLWLDSCGKASTPQLLAVVERFHAVYAEGVQIRTFAAGAPQCVATPARAGRARTDANRATEDLAYYATDRYGRSIMP